MLFDQQYAVLLEEQVRKLYGNGPIILLTCGLPDAAQLRKTPFEAALLCVAKFAPNFSTGSDVSDKAAEFLFKWRSELNDDSKIDNDLIMEYIEQLKDMVKFLQNAQ